MPDPTPAPAQTTPQAAPAATPDASAASAAAASATPAPEAKTGSEAAPAAKGTAMTKAGGEGTKEPASAGDTPSDADKAAGSKDGENQDKEKADGAPEAYEPFKLPENMEVNAEVMTKFQDIAKANGLPQDKAQELVGMGAELVTSAVEEFYNSQVESYAQKVDAWQATRAKDTEIGGTEEAQIKVLGAALKVARAVVGEPLVKALEETGAGDHPEIIRFFYRLKDIVGEDGKLIIANAGGTGPKTAAQAIYPNNPSQS